MNSTAPTSNSELPLVSIIIPTYNQSQYLHHAITSALAQDYPNLEVVVADDCSSDNTRVVVEPYLQDSRLKYFCNETNIGRVRNYKKALEEYAIGDWVVNCDGDDYYVSALFISEVMQQVALHEDVVFAQGGHQIRFVNTKQPSLDALPNISDEVHLYPKNEYFLSFHQIAHFSHITTIYRRDVAMAIDFYRHNISSTDIESFLRLSLHGSVILLKKIYGAWVQHGQNFSQTLDYKKREGNILYITESYQYALPILDKHRLDHWKKRALMYYFKNWLSKTAKSKEPLRQRVLDLIRILRFAWRFHQEVYRTFSFYATVVSLPYKLTM